MEVVRLGYVGCGFMAQNVHLPNFASLAGCRLVALAHDVFNVGVKLPWGSNHAQVRNFTSVKQQVRYLAKMGFERGRGLRLQAGDPTRNTLMVFTKRA